MNAPRPNFMTPNLLHPTMFITSAEAPINPSAEDLRLRDSIFGAISYLSISSCVIIIFIAILLSLHPLSKPKTDRVSFRIMIYALCGSVVYSITMILINRVEGHTTCRFLGSSTIFGLHLSSFLFFCIGLNLQLVMIHGIDGARAEKCYILGSLSLALVLSVVTYVSKQLVYDSTQMGCYYYDPNPVRGFWWRMGMQNIWSILTMAGEIVTFSSVVIYMIRVKVFESGPSRATRTTHSQGLSASHQYRRPLGPKQYRNIVLRISLYPLSSLATSGISALGNISSPNQEMKGRSGWIAVNGFRAAFLSRGTVYALVAAADPAITQGLKVLYRHYARRQTPNPLSNDIVFVRSAADHSSVAGDLALEDLQSHSENGHGGRQSCCFGSSRSSVTLPSIPKPAAISSHRDDGQLGTRSTRTSLMDLDVGSESQIDESDIVRYPYPKLRQL